MFKRKTNFINLILCVILAMLGAWIMRQGVLIYLTTYDQLQELSKPLAEHLKLEGYGSLINSLMWLVIAVGAFMTVAAILGLILKTRINLTLLRGSCVGYYFAFLALFYVSNRLLGDIQAKEILILGVEKPANPDIARWLWYVVWPYLGLLAVVMIAHINLWRRSVVNLYSGEIEEEPATGDRVLENMRTHGSDPRYRKSIFGSVFLHILVLFIIPWLIAVGCRDRYGVPKGKGNPVVALVRIVQPKKKKKKKRLILNPQSAIIFQQPDIDDSKILKEVNEETQLVYSFTRARAGKMGAGGPGKGGWPDGMEGAVIRFIRIRYSGREWDDGMDRREGADVNFLQYFHKITGFKVARLPEAKHPYEIKRFDKGYAPPFVYMTGNDRISMSNRDVKILREYMLDGGMIFADCGGVNWDSSFRAFARRLFPAKPLVPIPDDDPIFQMPYEFQNGAPPLWHHGGNRALGIKHNGRWCLFYHPGDINDAWKTGNSGLKKHQAAQAFEMGTNIIYYSFTRYLELTRKYRKQ